MRYDVVVATLNRVTTLKNCLATIETQSELPARVIIVDAGDDHAQLRSEVLRNRSGAIEWILLHSERKNLPYQRNLGVRQADSEVVLMPDDDSMLHPGAAAEVMAGYRADTGGLVAGVSGFPARMPPPAAGSTQIRRGRAVKDRFEPWRNRIEDRIAVRPSSSYPQSLWPQRAVPGWVDGQRFRLVEHITGFLLSMRSGIVKEHQFDETLGHGIGYALFEDMELSMRVQREGYLLIAAQQAPIFHDVHPGRRAGGFNYGFCWIANYIYACRKNMPADSRSWSRDLPQFLRYKIALYGTRALARRDPYSRDVLAGARTAWAARPALMDVDVTRLATAYDDLCSTFIRR